MSTDTIQGDKDAGAPTLADQNGFSLRGLPLLAQGTSNHVMGRAENLWLSAKVYAKGGENISHAHPKEDHGFMVLQGHATFHFEDGSIVEADPFEGVMLPKGVYYWFEASEGENLVLLRMGGAQRTTEGLSDFKDSGAPDEIRGTSVLADGSMKNGREARRGTLSYEVVTLPGRFFPED